MKSDKEKKARDDLFDDSKKDVCGEFLKKHQWNSKTDDSLVTSVILFLIK